VRLKVSLLNRALLYWGPALVGMLWAWRVIEDLPERSWQMPAFALALVAACEWWLFRFEIVLSSARIDYISPGLLRSKRVSVALDDVERIEVQSAVRNDRKPWTFVDLYTRASRGARTVTRINLAPFRRRDVQAFLQVLEQRVVANHRRATGTEAESSTP
jgi:hypothetical protein